MTDIVERLRAADRQTAPGIALMGEAADEIERLCAEIERLRGHMRALADTSIARDTAGIFKGLWQGSEQECEELRAEIERLDDLLWQEAGNRVEIERLRAVLEDETGETK